MNRLKLLAAVALLGIPLAACEESTPPPPVGSIGGQVSIEGTGIDGVSVNLSNGQSQTTSGGGNYRFDNVEGGAYTVTISGYPGDATFDATSQAATIASADQSITLNFTGSYIRTASVMGTVTVENDGIPGVVVRLAGASEATATTDGAGRYSFTGLRMGNYSIEISGFDGDEVGFSNTASDVSVAVGESKIVSFDGTYLRTAGLSGQVSAEGDGLEGVTVNLRGGPDGVDESTTTDASGQYAFARLRAGAYQVGISGFDTDDYEFDATSKSVTLALGQTGTVDFEGTLLRTSGVSGRVSVEGLGLADVTVTLSGGDLDADQTATTDAGGQYAFAGLAAGEYTVAISGQDTTAYVFESTSASVTLGDDESAIVNFDGSHATTASISGRLFIDEVTKNDTHDEGETLLNAAGVALLLVGPGLNDQRPGVTNADGAFSFANLRAGTYQLAVVSGEAIPADHGYGGPATGYTITIGVGEAHTQHIPIDITHQTVNYTVHLRHGDMTGDALPGAMVHLYASMTANDPIASGQTNETGTTSIRFARSAASGNMAYANVTAPNDGYDVDGARQVVEWASTSATHDAMNSQHVVNLKTEFNFNGQTITTDHGGGRALGNWAINVTQMGTGGRVAVANAPKTLDDDGVGKITMTATSIDDLPMTYHIALAGDQSNTLDGGETYVTTDTLTATHNGLSVDETMDAGTMEARYTTQTLKVYVHHEKDQILGYTENILDGDERVSGVLDVEIRHIDANGRSRAFTKAQWDRAKTGNYSDSSGVVTFAHVPADFNVIAQASRVDANADIMLLEPDEIAAYRDIEENGVTGGAFGADGGFHHTVELCPLASEEHRQGGGECGSFAYVSTWAVSGLVWKSDVIRSGEGFLVRGEGDIINVGNGPRSQTGVTVSLDPVADKNLAGDQESQTTTATNIASTRNRDDRYQFNFGRIAAGVYKLNLPNGWRARLGDKGSEVELGSALSPLSADITIDVTPATATLYGRVTGTDGFGLDSVTVTANGKSAMTDALGRYIIEGISRGALTNKIIVSAAGKGVTNYTDAAPYIDFVANAPIREDFNVNAVAATATVSGMVTTDNGTPVAGVTILANNAAPLNAARSGTNRGRLVTGADGSFTASVRAVPVGQTVSMSASRTGMSFFPASIPVSATNGSTTSGIKFTAYAYATITGRVKSPTGGPMQGVLVSATPAGGTAPTDTMTTGTTGTFSLSVPFGAYTIAATADNHTFSYPNTGQLVNVAHGQNYGFGDIQAVTFAPTITSATRVIDAQTGVYDGNVRVVWSHGTIGDRTINYQVQYQHNTGDGANATWADLGAVNGPVTSAATGPNTLTASASLAGVTDTLAFKVRIMTYDGSTPPDTVYSAEASVGSINPAATNVRASRGPENDSLVVTWRARTSNASAQRVMVEVHAESVGATVWLNVGPIDSAARAWRIEVTSADVTWTLPDGTGVAVTEDELNKALRIRVDSRQGGESAPWKNGTPVSLAAKPTSS